MLEALHYGAKFNAEQLHWQELGIATLSALFMNANRDPKKSDPAKASDFYYFKPDNDSTRIPSDACDAFFSLSKDGLLASWTVAIAPIDKLRRYKSDKPVRKPRAWIGDDVILILPKVGKDGIVRFPLAIVNGAIGLTQVRDPDTNTLFCLRLPDGEKRWVLDGSFELVS